MIKIENDLLNEVSVKAKNSSRRRMNHNFHKDYSDTLQRLLNVMEPFSYIQPHKHESPDKREVFLILKGRMAVVEFNETGIITDHILLDPLMGTYGAEIAERTYHTIIALDPGTVAFEVKDGPYNAIDDKNFAPWAPKEGDPGARKYLKGILQKTGIV